MYRDIQQWMYVRHRVLRIGVPIRQVVRETSISRHTVRKMLAYPVPPAYGPRSRKPRVRRRITAAPNPGTSPQEVRQETFDWMRALLQNEIGTDALRREIRDIPDLAHLLQKLHGGKLSERNKSMAVLASLRGVKIGLASSFLGIDRKTTRKYLRAFAVGGSAALFSRQTTRVRKSENETLKQAVFALLHEPPSNHGINRTTWKMADLCRVLGEAGTPVCPEVVRTITRRAGYRWRKARVVLTSADPDYRQKLDRIRGILSELGQQEAFFSIDEFGPFAVKMKLVVRWPHPTSSGSSPNGRSLGVV